MRGSESGWGCLVTGVGWLEPKVGLAAVRGKGRVALGTGRMGPVRASR